MKCKICKKNFRNLREFRKHLENRDIKHQKYYEEIQIKLSLKQKINCFCGGEIISDITIDKENWLDLEYRCDKCKFIWLKI